MDALTQRDRDVLDLLSEGASDIEVCRRLQISETVLKQSVKRIEARAASHTDVAGVRYERALRRRGENALTSLAARFHALMSVVPGAVLVVDGRTGIIKEANEAACKLFGFSQPELLGRSVEDLVPGEYRTVHPAYRIGFLSSVRKREMGYHPPIYGVKADGAKIEVSIALTATTSDDDVMVVCTEKKAWMATKGGSKKALADS